MLRLSSTTARALLRPSNSRVLPLPAQNARYMSDEEREKLRNSRPISPHLTIYRLPVAAQLHFGHRASGVGMTLGVFYFLSSTFFNFLQLSSTFFNFLQLSSTFFNFLQLSSTFFNANCHTQVQQL
jgi:hypothetical protein